MANKHVKYGWSKGPGKGEEVPLAASQYFHRLGGHFVQMNAAGNASLCTLSTELNPLGWAQPAKDTAGKNSWLSSSTAGADKVFVVTGKENKFWMPVDNAVGSANATYVGKNACFSSANATHALVQKAYYKATAASCAVKIYDFDADNDLVLVGLL